MQASMGALCYREVPWRLGGNRYRIHLVGKQVKPRFPQRLGLATPLFTQVIIDKVVVHQTHSTLIVLGSQVFRHQLRLPLPYFEHRPTGTLVARLHGIETIREFVSGAASTSRVGQQIFLA